VRFSKLGHAGRATHHGGKMCHGAAARPMMMHARSKEAFEVISPRFPALISPSPLATEAVRLTSRRLQNAARWNNRLLQLVAPVNIITS
jgi:hypothetical protein